jgi:hypothetical protein
MEKKFYDEMVQMLTEISKQADLSTKSIFFFGHCSATLELIDLLENFGLKTTAILDNSDAKQGKVYKGAIVVYPRQIYEYLEGDFCDNSIVIITSRFYEAMLQQLKELGYKGSVRKFIDFNTFADYSLADDTIARMKLREKHGEDLIAALSKKYPGYFKTFCSFNALGDIYFMISYWDEFARKRSIEQTVFCVSSSILADVIHMFGAYQVEVYEQKELDAMIQASLYVRDKNTFIAHQDRPYVVNLSKALYVKKISLGQIYCCGVYGLPKDTIAAKPNTNTYIYKDIEFIPAGKSVLFSPYAKSVISIESKIWKDAVSYYSDKGYKCYTNVVGNETPIEGTEAISPSIMELRSVVERAGTFIGIRSGLCDVLREAKAKKIALYPDYYYCDTKWKAIEMYWIDQFEYNLLATEEIKWETL